MSAKAQRFEAILAPVIEGLGYRCWGIEFQSQGRRSVLRIFLDDTDHAVGVDDCEKISRQVSAVLDVEDPIQTEYTLEVSSPGMDRPLFSIEQFRAWAGYQVRVRLRMAFEGRRKFEGLLKGVEGNDVVIIIDENEILLPIDAIEKANIVPVFE